MATVDETPEGHGEPQDEEVNIEYDTWVLTTSQAIKFISLLQQFANLEVRSDFINMKFGREVNPNWLEIIDELRCSLIPWISGNSANDVHMRSRIAAGHLYKLVNKSTDIYKFVTYGLDTEYKEIFKILDTVLSATYWNETKPSERCSHFDKPVTGQKFKKVAHVQSIYSSESSISESSSETDSEPIVPKKKFSKLSRKEVVTPPPCFPNGWYS